MCVKSEKDEFKTKIQVSLAINNSFISQEQSVKSAST